MTSSVQQTKTSLESFLFSSATSPQFVNSILTSPTLPQLIKQSQLVQKRKHSNLQIKDQQYENARRYKELFKISKKQNIVGLFREPDLLVEQYGFSLNTNAFLSTIQLIGDQKQVNHWQKLVLDGKIIGGYGQTELGHGSNVQMLQTQATYDQKKQVFVINSPTITSSKFWPGCFGTYSTHCVLQAKTFVKGKNIGVQTFVFPMRDIKLNSLPGVQCGDIGPKLGFFRVDNGFLKINNVQIPRENMLMKYVKVHQNGEVQGLENKQAIKYAYGSMLNLRVKLVNGFAIGFIIWASLFQHQIWKEMGIQNEPQNKKRTIQLISTGMGYLLANIHVKSIFNQFIDNIHKSNFQKADMLLVSCHIISSTFKALSSWKGLQTTKQVMTGTKYGTFSSTYLTRYFSDSIPSVTYEGDNTVLLQQTAKFILMKEKQNQLTKPKQQVDPSNLNHVHQVLSFIASSQIRHLKVVFQKQVENGLSFKSIWNEKYQRNIIEVSKLWGYMTLIKCVIITLSEKNIPDQLRTLFTKLSQVFASQILKEVPHVPFYGFKVQQSKAWQTLTNEEFAIITSLSRPLAESTNKYQFQARGNKSDWMYAKL